MTLGDSIAGQADAGGRWTLGNEVACDSPVPLAYTESRPLTAYPAPTSADAGAIEHGGIALVGGRLFWTTPGGGVAWAGLNDAAAGTLDVTVVQGFSIADLDGDGAPDLLLSGVEMYVVWDAGEGDPVPVRLPGEQAGYVHRDATALDLDADGDLDVVSGRSSADADLPPIATVLENLGGRRFADPKEVAPATADFWGQTFDIAAADADADGDLDVYLCNDLGDQQAPNGLLIQDEGVLKPAVDAHGLDVRMNCMSAAWADVDGNGRLDAVVSDVLRPYLLLNNGAVYADASDALIGMRFKLPEMIWSLVPADVDNDAAIDLLMTVGDFWRLPVTQYRSRLYRQDLDGTFGDLPLLPTAASTRGLIARDLNGDGALDLIVGDALTTPHVLMANGCSDAAWLEVEAPSGSLVTIEAANLSRTALATSESGFASAGPSVAHFGLGDAGEVARIAIRAPEQPEVSLDGPITVNRVVRWASP